MSAQGEKLPFASAELNPRERPSSARVPQLRGLEINSCNSRFSTAGRL